MQTPEPTCRVFTIPVTPEEHNIFSQLRETDKRYNDIGGEEGKLLRAEQAKRRIPYVDRFKQKHNDKFVEDPQVVINKWSYLNPHGRYIKMVNDVPAAFLSGSAASANYRNMFMYDITNQQMVCITRVKTLEEIKQMHELRKSYSFIRFVPNTDANYQMDVNVF